MGRVCGVAWVSCGYGSRSGDEGCDGRATMYDLYDVEVADG